MIATKMEVKPGVHLRWGSTIAVDDSADTVTVAAAGGFDIAVTPNPDDLDSAISEDETWELPGKEVTPIACRKCKGQPATIAIPLSPFCLIAICQDCASSGVLLP